MEATADDGGGGEVVEARVAVRVAAAGAVATVAG